MIAALLLGRKGSQGFPNKNLWPINGNPLAWYPLQAALNANSVDKVFMSTDDERLMTLARENGAEVIERKPFIVIRIFFWHRISWVDLPEQEADKNYPGCHSRLP